MSENVKHLSDENFKSTIASGVTLVDFYADWCGPCRMVAPIVNELADELKGKATIAKVDIDNSQAITSNYDITSVPTMILFKDGKEINRIVGVSSKKSLEKLIVDSL